MFQGHDEHFSTKYPKEAKNTKKGKEIQGNEWNLVWKKTLATAPKTNQGDKEPNMKRTK